jgi:hypothetical protein
MTLLLALLLGSYEPECLAALARFEDSPPPGAACTAGEWHADRGWIASGEAVATPFGFEPAEGLWSSPDRACELAHRVLEAEGVESFVCLGGEGLKL